MYYYYLEGVLFQTSSWSFNLLRLSDIAISKQDYRVIKNRYNSLHAKLNEDIMDRIVNQSDSIPDIYDLFDYFGLEYSTDSYRIDLLRWRLKEGRKI